MRLDVFLAQKEGLSRTKCRQMILEGKVRVEGTCVTKPSFPVLSEEKVEVVGDKGFVSRGALKLEGALEKFCPMGLKISGRECIDVGASTGGFTQVLLKWGAKDVIALDVGRDQLSPLLQNDPRVRNMEGVNIRFLSPSSLPISPTLATADLSFISLRMALPKIFEIKSVQECVALVKPQFEVGKGKLGKGGVVKDEKEREKSLEAVKEAAKKEGLKILSSLPSPLAGEKGNREFLLWLHR